MKMKIRRLISIVLSLALLTFGYVIPTTAAGSSASATGDGTVGELFSSSFEDDDGLTLVENTAGAAGSQNVISSTASGVYGYVDDLVLANSIKGSGDTGNEGMQQLFDGTVDTKFFQNVIPTADSPVWVSFQLSSAQVITQYSICAANDNQSRDPADWTLYGSADGKSWTALDSRSGETFYSRYQENIYLIDGNTTAYAYYKFSVTAKRQQENADGTQFSELRLGTGTGEVYDPLSATNAGAAVVGCVSDEVKRSSISGSADNGTESKYNLFDVDTGTKCFIGFKPTSSDPAFVSFQLEEAQVITTYAIASANDFSERDPKSWTLYGSSDGENWTAMDSRSGQTFSDRYTYNTYSISNTAAYDYYKIVVTENNGADACVQFSELQLGTGIASTDTQAGGNSSMITEQTGGPAKSWNNYTGVGWTGYSCLKAAGSHVGDGEAYATNVIYEDVNIPVYENTQLSYVIFPAISKDNSYDFDYTSQYMAVDLLFDDGTYLSDLGATDIYGNGMDAVSQGESKTLAYMQWNQVIGNIGSVAAGKTVKKILISYEQPSSTCAISAPFLTYFDDIVIENTAEESVDHLADYVNIFRGSDSTKSFSRGLTSPVVLTPHGFNMVSPVTENASSLHYNYQNNSICHLELTHIATAWGSSYGDWQFMANTSFDESAVTSADEISAENRRATFSHDNETGHAHYYGVTFDEDSVAAGVKIEVTPTEHAMVVRFTFPKGSENRNVIFDDVFSDGQLTLNDDNQTFSVYTDHLSDGGNRMYVYGEFDQSYDAAQVFNNKTGILSFPEDENGDTVVTMKIATSFISEEQAEHNLALEVSDSDTFASVFERAREEWDDQLGIIELEGADDYELETFYSNMYRLFAYPNTYSENVGTNEDPVWKHANPRSSDYANPEICDGELYVNNGFWDTYRTTWAAYALLTPTKDAEMLNGLISFYKDTGGIPRWTNPGGADSMTGTHIETILGDAAMRGIDFDLTTAYEACVKSANALSTSLQSGGRKENNTYPFTYFISNGTTYGLSWSMDNYLNDYGTSQLASALGDTDTATYLKNRALAYTTMFNSSVGGFFTGKNSDGTFSANASSYDPTDWWGDYTETNAWNMSFSVTQDVNGLANLLGGKDALAERLDELFNADPSMNDDGTIHEMREVREVRMGMYGHSNQPSHAIPYFYDYVGQPYKTQEIVREVLSRMYVGSGIGQGYYGDDDNGEQSAWYIFSALGLYPVSMGNAEYAIGSPLFTKATIHLENGKDLVISAPNNSDENIYVQGVKVNGVAYNDTYITHDVLAAGGTIEFDMGSTPSTWGTGDDAAPTSITTGTNMPYAQADLTTADIVTTKGLSAAKYAMIATRSTSDTANLFDNNSGTAATLTGSNKSVFFYTPEAKTVTMYTVSSSSDASKAPSSFTLYGSNDGSNWTELDSRTNETFQWNQYVRPFTVSEEKQAAYRYYELSFADTSDVEISELEFIGGLQLTSSLYDVDGISNKITVDSDTDYDTFMANTSGVVSITKNGVAVVSGALETGMIVTDEAGNEYTIVAGTLKLGDVDKNGSVTVSDVVELRDIIMKSSWDAEQLYAGDLDGNGTLTVSDVVDLRDLIMKGVS